MKWSKILSKLNKAVLSIVKNNLIHFFLLKLLAKKLLITSNYSRFVLYVRAVNICGSLTLNSYNIKDSSPGDVW